MSNPPYPAIAHEHGDLRQELSTFALALANANCPAPGHALHGVLELAATYFERELPHHVREEEAVFYPQLIGLVPPASLARMREQHLALLVMAPMFTRQQRAFAAAPSPRTWSELQHIGGRLVVAIRQHIDFEEAVLGAIALPTSPEGS